MDKNLTTSGQNFGPARGRKRLEPLRRCPRQILERGTLEAEDTAMTGIEIVVKLAELKQQYEDEHRPTRSLETYRKRHARRHAKLDHDGELHVSQYQPPA